jgi:hypothetical protein
LKGAVLNLQKLATIPNQQSSNHTKVNAVSVVYLIWIPYGIALFQRFLHSYKVFKSGYEHHLILLFNGVESEEATSPFHQFAAGENLVYTSYYKRTGQDLEAYFWIAPQLNTDYILFLNSFSELLAEDWLLKYMKAVTQVSNVGLIGASASYQSYSDTIYHENSWAWRRTQSTADNIKKYKLLIKAHLLYRVYFKPFPNPHIRTTGFFISKKLFLSISFNQPKNKMQAYRFESGRNGFTRQVLKRNLAVILMDKHGRVYPIPDWYGSQTFWTRNQENLLVSDNQTERFRKADDQERRVLTFRAWGVYE